MMLVILSEVAMKRRYLTRERKLNNVCIIVLVIYLQFKALLATIVNDSGKIYTLHLKDDLNDRTRYSTCDLDQYC